MRFALAPLVSMAGAFGLSAQTSPAYKVHHEFAPPSGAVYFNSGSTGAANDGTFAGNVTPTTGALGSGVALGGLLGDQVVCGNTPVFGAQERTVSIWVRTTAAAGVVTPLAFGLNSSNGTKWDMDIDCANGGVFELGVGGGRTVGGGPPVNDGQWHMLTAVLPPGAGNLGQVRMFVDGVLAYTGSGTQVVNTSYGSLLVGRSVNPGTQVQCFPGEVDDPVLWSVALGDAQVKGLHDVAIHPFLTYSPREYEMLLELYRQTTPQVALGSLLWQRATGMTGPAGLTALPNGGFELVFDTATGSGVKVVYPATVQAIGSGCPGTGGQTPMIAASAAPIVGTSVAIQMQNARPNSFGGILLAFVRNDTPVGNGCVIHPLLPGFSALVGISGAGAAGVSVSIPAASALVNLQMFAQWCVLDPAGAYGPNVAAFSGALALTLGDY